MDQSGSACSEGALICDVDGHIIEESRACFKGQFSTYSLQCSVLERQGGALRRVVFRGGEFTLFYPNCALFNDF